MALQRCIEHSQLRDWVAADSGNESRLLRALGIGQQVVYSAIWGGSPKSDSKNTESGSIDTSRC